MRKNISLLFCLLLVSCINDQLLGPIEETTGKEIILAVSVEEPVTKSGVSQYGSFYWTKDDQLAIFTTENRFKTLKLKDGAGLPSATFSGVLSNSEFPTDIAVFPAQIASSYKNGKLDIVLPERYEYNEDYAIGNPPMLASFTSGGSIIFNHLCAMVRFTLDQVPAGAASVRLSSEGSKLTGVFTVSLDEGAGIDRIDSDSGNSIAVEFETLDYPKTMTFSFTLPVGTYENLCIDILDVDKSVIWSGKQTSSKTFESGQLMEFNTISPFPKVIDLGLPSGTLWADRNIGANKPTDHGSLFAWGETVVKDDYTMGNYTYYDEDGKLTKYNNVDNLVELDPADDIAALIWGDRWRTPTKEQMQELLDNCMEEKKSGYAVYTGPNGNSIILSYGGIKYDGRYYGYQGHYWTRTLSSLGYQFWTNAYCFHLYSSFSTSIAANSRYQGLLIRPVYSSDNYIEISSTSISLFKDETYDLDVSGYDVGVIWKSENESIATVNDNGTVTGLNEGQTTIIVTSADGEMKQSCVVRVVPDISSSVSARYSGGAMTIINGVVQSGSRLYFTLNNNGNRAIKIDKLYLIDGVSENSTESSISHILAGGKSVSYSIRVGSGGVQKPICRFEYLYEGKTYQVECTVPMNY